MQTQIEKVQSLKSQKHIEIIQWIHNSQLTKFINGMRNKGYKCNKNIHQKFIEYTIINKPGRTAFVCAHCCGDKFMYITFFKIG